MRVQRSARLLLLFLAGAGAAADGWAQDAVTRGRTYWAGNTCTTCHGTTPSSAAAAPYTVLLGEAWMNAVRNPANADDPSTLRGRLRAAATHPSGSIVMATLANSGGTDLDDMFAYLEAVRDGVHSLSSAPTVPVTAVSRSSAPRPFQITIENRRTADMAYAVTLSSAVAGDFTLTTAGGTPIASISGSCGGTGTGAPVTCTVDGHVVFSPQGPALRQASLLVTPSWPSTSLPTAPRAATESRRTFTVQGTGVAALIVPGAGVTRTFATSAASPTATTTVSVTDNVGDAVDACLLAGMPPFNGLEPTPSYTLSAPNSSANDNCRAFAAQAGVSPSSPRTLDITVTFAPGAVPGPRNAVLSVQRLSATAVTIPLSGNAGPDARVEADRLFGADGVEVDGAASAERVLRVFSRGNAPVSFGATAFRFADGQRSGDTCLGTPAVPAANSGEYTVLTETCTAAPLAAYTGTPGPTTECSVRIRFDPQAVGRRCGILTVVSTAAPQTVVLEGSGFLGPRLVVLQGGAAQASGTLLDFTAQLLQGVTYPPKTLTLRNGGTAGDLELALPAATALPGFRITAGPNCSLLAPYSASTDSPTCSLQIAFVPTELRAYTGALDIVTRPAGSPAPGVPFRVNLAGVGSNIAPSLRWEDAGGMPITSLAFGRVEGGTACTTCELRVFLRNQGVGGARFDLVNAIGPDGGSFAVRKDGCAADGFLADGGPRCAVVVRFDPTTAGSKSATLQAVTTGNGPPALALTGEFVSGSLAPVLAVSQGTAFAATRAGARSLPVEFVLSNGGNFPLRVLDLRVTGPFAIAGSTCPARPFALEAGTACKVAVAFEPAGAGPATGTLEVATDATAGVSRSALSASADAEADLSSGGCSIASGEVLHDPLWWAMVLVAVALLLRRERARRRAGDAGRPR